jgi:hypothetical protein
VARQLFPSARTLRLTMTTTFAFTAAIWEHEGPGAWHFVSLPHDVADEIAETKHGRTGGFGSVRVEVTVGGSTWRTSLFPDGRRGTYLLPVKRAVRKAEALTDGSRASIHVLLLDHGRDDSP